MEELFAPALNFTLFAAAIVFIVRKPFRNMMLARRAGVETQVLEAQKLKAEAEAKYREFSEKLAAFESDAKSILAKAQTDAQLLREKIISDAKKSAERIVKDAEMAVESNIQDYKNQIRKETIAQAVELAERMIKQGLSVEDQRRFVNEYVGKVQ